MCLYIQTQIFFLVCYKTKTPKIHRKFDRLEHLYTEKTKNRSKDQKVKKETPPPSFSAFWFLLYTHAYTLLIRCRSIPLPLCMLNVIEILSLPTYPD